jgi:hypothetical protein
MLSLSCASWLLWLLLSFSAAPATLLARAPEESPVIRAQQEIQQLADGPADG